MTPYYSDDAVTIYHGDSREWMPRLTHRDSESSEWCLAHEAAVIVTDPPYGITWRQHGGGRMNVAVHAGIANDDDTSARDDVLAAWGDRPAAVFGSWYAPFPTGVVQVLVHQKASPAGVVGSTLGWRRDTEPIFLLGPWPKRNAKWSGVLTSRVRLQALTSDHPHAKPVDVLARLIEAAPVGIILDPFMGSGSTLVAAKSLGRKAIGIEIEERYCEIAANRCRQEVLGLVG